MRKEDTAIVLIECQNEFCSPEGVLYNAVKDILKANKMIENTKKLLKASRGKCHVIHVPIVFEEGYPELDKHPYGILKGVVDSKAFLKHSVGSKFFADLLPQPYDVVAEGKKTLSAFNSSNLEFILRSNDIKKIVLGGFLTNICVEATARSAYDKGYEVFILSDCTAATSIEEQNFATEKILPLFSKVITSIQFIEMLNNDAAISVKDRSYYD